MNKILYGLVLIAFIGFSAWRGWWGLLILAFILIYDTHEVFKS